MHTNFNHTKGKSTKTCLNVAANKQKRNLAYFFRNHEKCDKVSAIAAWTYLTLCHEVSRGVNFRRLYQQLHERHNLYVIFEAYLLFKFKVCTTGTVSTLATLPYFVWRKQIKMNFSDFSIFLWLESLDVFLEILPVVIFSLAVVYSCS